MDTAQAIIDFVGADEAQAALGIQRPAMRHALREGRFPAAWYHTLETMAGRPLPRELFSFRADRREAAE